MKRRRKLQVVAGDLGTPPRIDQQGSDGPQTRIPLQLRDQPGKRIPREHDIRIEHEAVFTRPLREPQVGGSGVTQIFLATDDPDVVALLQTVKIFPSGRRVIHHDDLDPIPTGLVAK